jgi:hypothetical protein
MLPIEPDYIRARLAEQAWAEPIVELGAGWDLEFHQYPIPRARKYALLRTGRAPARRNSARLRG